MTLKDFFLHLRKVYRRSRKQ